MRSLARGVSSSSRSTFECSDGATISKMSTGRGCRRSLRFDRVGKEVESLRFAFNRARDRKRLDMLDVLGVLGTTGLRDRVREHDAGGGGGR
jgi:hypothetical protein